MPDTTDDVRAAFEAAKTPDPSGAPSNIDPGSSNDDFAPQRSETLPPVMPDNKDGPPAPKEPPKVAEAPKPPAPVVPQQRGPDGKFLPQQPQQLGAPSDQPPEDGSVRFDPAKPPQGWTQAMKDKWSTIPEDVRNEITRREEATANGVQRLMERYEPMAGIYNVVQPFGQYFQHIQEDPQQYLHSMITMEQTLRLGNPAQKMELLMAVAETYGVPLRNVLNEALGGKFDEMMQQAHQHHQTPPPVPPEIMRELQEQRQWRSQMEDSAAEGELAEFAEQPGHEYLDYLRDDMADLLESGVVESYQDAYDLAAWRNPQVRAAIQQGAAPAPLPGSIPARQAAAAAVVAPTGAPLNVATDDGKDGDVYDDVRKAWNANVSGGMR